MITGEIKNQIDAYVDGCINMKDIILVEMMFGDFVVNGYSISIRCFPISVFVCLLLVKGISMPQNYEKSAK